MIHMCNSSCQNLIGEQGALFSPFKIDSSGRKEENVWVEISFTQSVLSTFGTLQSIGRLLCVDMGEHRLWLGVGSGGVCGSV